MSESRLTLLSPDLLAATEVLAENLARSEPIWAYHQAQASLNQDSEANGLLERYNRGVAEWRVRQSQGQATPAEGEMLRELQQAVRFNATIGQAARAQQAARAYLREINAEVSQLLGLDFGALAQRGGCC
jgi:cell fate (sporulation/competence/biofilm development) regulator YlbF (YheA/YmcA/DUF963 family)